MNIPLRLTSFVRLASLSAFSLSLLLAGCGGGSNAGGVATGTTGTTPAAVALTIASVSPKDVLAGSPAVALVVTGTGFTPSSVITLNGTAEPTVYVSSTEIRATVAAAQLQVGKILALTVTDGTRVVAADATNNLQVSNPTPTLTAIAPAVALVGSGATSLAVTGTNFVSGALVDVNGSPRDTTFVSGTQLTVTLPATDVALAGSLLFNVCRR